MPCGKQSAKLILHKCIDQLKLEEKLKNFIIILVLSVFLLIGVFFVGITPSSDRVVLNPKGPTENYTDQTVSQTKLNVTKGAINGIVDINKKKLSAISSSDLKVKVNKTQREEELRGKIDTLILKMDKNKYNPDEREKIESEIHSLMAEYNVLILPTAMQKLEISTQLNR